MVFNYKFCGKLSFFLFKELGNILTEPQIHTLKTGIFWELLFMLPLAFTLPFISIANKEQEGNPRYTLAYTIRRLTHAHTKREIRTERHFLHAHTNESVHCYFSFC